MYKVEYIGDDGKQHTKTLTSHFTLNVFLVRLDRLGVEITNVYEGNMPL